MHSYFGKWVASSVFVINFADFAFFCQSLINFCQSFLSYFFILNVDERRNCSFGGRLYSGPHWVYHDRLLDRFWSQPHSFKFHTFWATYWNFAPRCSFRFSYLYLFWIRVSGFFNAFFVFSFFGANYLWIAPKFSLHNISKFFIVSKLLLVTIILHIVYSYPA